MCWRGVLNSAITRRSVIGAAFDDEVGRALVNAPAGITRPSVTAGLAAEHERTRAAGRMTRRLRLAPATGARNRRFHSDRIA